MTGRSKLSQLKDIVRLRALQEQLARRAAHAATQVLIRADQDLRNETQSLSDQQQAWLACLSEPSLDVDAIRLQHAQAEQAQERVLHRQRDQDAASKEADRLRQRWGAALLQKTGLDRATRRLDRQVTRREEDRMVASVEDILLARRVRR